MTKRGFTLIELLVVISIIGLLSSIAMASLSTARGRARYALVYAQLRQIANAAEMYRADHDSYPIDGWPGDPGHLAPGGISPFLPYLSVWPTPPCSNWAYDWENETYTDGSGKKVYRITVRSNTATEDNSVLYFCLFSEKNDNCAMLPPDFAAHNGGGGVDIKTLNPPVLTCQETEY